MTIGMTARQGKRWGLSALAAMACWIGDPAASLAGDGPSVFGRIPQGPIFKTLDAFAGGIELVLEKTVLSNGKAKRGCDSPSCDDGCDAITLHQLDLQRGGQMAVPEVYHPSPTAKPTVPPLAPMPLAPGHAVPPMIEVEPTFDRPVRKTLPQPMPESTQLQVPKSAPRALPQVPVETQMTPVQKQMPQADLSSDDSWIDSFAPSTPNRNPPPPRRQGPASDDSLFDPFADDPQTRAVPPRFSPTARSAAPAESARPQVRKSVKAAGFARPH